MYTVYCTVDLLQTLFLRWVESLLTPDRLSTHKIRQVYILAVHIFNQQWSIKNQTTIQIFSTSYQYIISFYSSVHVIRLVKSKKTTTIHFLSMSYYHTIKFFFLNFFPFFLVIIRTKTYDNNVDFIGWRILCNQISFRK